MLARYAPLGWMDIELKVRGVEAPVAELLRRYRPARGFVVSSFRRPVLLELHRIDPWLPLAFIFDRMPRGKGVARSPHSICEAERATGDPGAGAAVPRGRDESADVDGESSGGDAPAWRGWSGRDDWGRSGEARGSEVLGLRDYAAMTVGLRFFGLNRKRLRSSSKAWISSFMRASLQ